MAPGPSPVLARKPSSGLGRYRMRLSWVFTGAVSWLGLCLARFAWDRLSADLPTNHLLCGV